MNFLEKGKKGVQKGVQYMQKQSEIMKTNEKMKTCWDIIFNATETKPSWNVQAYLLALSANAKFSKTEEDVETFHYWKRGLRSMRKTIKSQREKEACRRIFSCEKVILELLTIFSMAIVALFATTNL